MTDEVSRADQKRQDRLTEKPKETEKPKDGPSQFDRVLEESKALGSRTPPPTQSGQKALTEQAAREAERREDRQREEEKRDDKDKGKGKDQGRGEKKGATDVQGRVTAKGSMKDGRGGGGSEGRGGFSGGDKRSVAQTQIRSSAKAVTSGLHGKFADKLQASIAKSVAEPGLPQAVLNQIVQYVRVGINRMGDKEMQIDLHEKIFKGLKLRVTSHKGKVDVHFIAANEDTRSVFEKNKDSIRQALEKKGILVEDIRVT